MTVSGMVEALLVMVAVLWVAVAHGLPVDFAQEDGEPDPLVETTSRDDATARQWVEEPGHEEMSGIVVTRRAGEGPGTGLPVELLNAHSWGAFDALTSDGTLGWFRMLIGDFVTLAERSGRAPWMGDEFSEGAPESRMGVLASGKDVGDMVLRKHGEAMVEELKSAAGAKMSTDPTPAPEVTPTFSLDSSGETGPGFNLDPGFNPDAEGAANRKESNPLVPIIIVIVIIVFVGFGVLLRPT